MRNAGFTLIEVLISILILVTAVGALALIYPGMLKGISSDFQALTAWEIAKNQIETLKNSSFDTLLTGSFAQGEAPVIHAFSTGVTNTSGVYYIETMRDKDNNVLTDLVRIQVVVCYKSNNRLTGEDKNLNGTLDSGEDANLDSRMSSPVTLSTLVTSVS